MITIPTTPFMKCLHLIYKSLELRKINSRTLTHLFNQIYNVRIAFQITIHSMQNIFSNFRSQLITRYSIHCFLNYLQFILFWNIMQGFMIHQSFLFHLLIHLILNLLNHSIINWWSILRLSSCLHTSMFLQLLNIPLLSILHF